MYYENPNTKDKIAKLFTTNPRHILQILKESGYEVDQLVYLEKCFALEIEKFPLFKETISQFAEEILCSDNLSTKTLFNVIILL